MPIEQYAALVQLLPQIEDALTKDGEDVPRPNYKNEVKNGTEMEGVEEEKETEPKSKKQKKANIEATSDEEESD